VSVVAIVVAKMHLGIGILGLQLLNKIFYQHAVLLVAVQVSILAEWQLLVNRFCPVISY